MEKTDPYLAFAQPIDLPDPAFGSSTVPAVWSEQIRQQLGNWVGRSPLNASE